MLLPEGFSVLSTLVLETLVGLGDKPLKVSVLQTLPHLKVSVEVKGVKVTPQAAREDHRILEGE